MFKEFCFTGGRSFFTRLQPGRHEGFKFVLILDDAHQLLKDESTDQRWPVYFYDIIQTMTKYPYKRIMILGDSGRGKSTFGKKLFEKIHIPLYSTDDFFWKTRFSESRDRQQSIEAISRVYDGDEWIMEGGTRHLILKGLERADIIYLLEFKNILYQYYFLIWRNLGRKNENFIDLFNLLKHITYKKYKKNYGNHLPRLKKLLEPYKNKVVRLNSFKAINQCLQSVDNK